MGGKLKAKKPIKIPSFFGTWIVMKTFHDKDWTENSEECLGCVIFPEGKPTGVCKKRNTSTKGSLQESHLVEYGGGSQNKTKYASDFIQF